MPRLSLYTPEKSNNYRYMDRVIGEQFITGGTDLYIHKYLGTPPTGPSSDATQPQYTTTSPTNIQDLLFLENRDRKYETDIIRLRGHYNVQNLDFDLSQFGLFLNNDVIFITVHYNSMIDIVGRKIMTGDVIELPHLLDYHPLTETLPYALKRFYQITDANFASEGFSSTWYPHLWRIKCEPLVDTQEFAQILSEPGNRDNYLGQWEAGKTYPQGYVVTYGDKNYSAIKEVPVDKTPPNEEFWKLDTEDTLRDILGTYNTNIKINDAILQEAKRQVPLSGYDNTNLYVVPTYDEIYPKLVNQPAPPTSLLVPNGAPVIITGTMAYMRSPDYKTPSPVLRVSKETAKSIWDLTADMDMESIDAFVQLSLQTVELAPERNASGSGEVSGDTALVVQSLGAVTGPYGTSDNTYSRADQNPVAPGFTGNVTQSMDYRADCDPRYQYIARSTPRSFGYTAGYLTGDGKAPDGAPSGAGISFPKNPKVGDYFLRIDYLPQILYRWDGKLWVRISENVRTGTGLDADDRSQKSTFINNKETTTLTDGTKIPQKQSLSKVLRPKPDNIPPRS